MPRTCEKLVEFQWQKSRKTYGIFIHQTVNNFFNPTMDRVKMLLFQTLSTNFHSKFSLGCEEILHLFEHKFYPVSTIPTITKTKEKI